MKAGLMAIVLLLGPAFLRAENDFWLVAGDDGKDQVRVIQGGTAGIKMVGLGEEADETDDQGKHWNTVYTLLRWEKTYGGYVLTRHLHAYNADGYKNFVKAFDSAGKLRFTLGPIALTPLSMAEDSARISLGRVHGTDIERTADLLVFTDGKGAVAYKESGQFGTRVRFSPNGDWVAYIAGSDLVMRQFSTNESTAAPWWRSPTSAAARW